MMDRLTEQEKAANRRRWWGLTDPANEPAGVQRPEPALTEAELENYWHQGSLYQWAVRRLIADLRAKNEELNQWRTAATLRAEASQQWEQRAVVAEADVERLNQLLAFYAGSDDPLRGP